MLAAGPGAGLRDQVGLRRVIGDISTDRSRLENGPAVDDRDRQFAERAQRLDLVTADEFGPGHRFEGDSGFQKRPAATGGP